MAFEVLPDHRKASVERKLRDHAFIRKLLDCGACDFDLPQVNRIEVGHDCFISSTSNPASVGSPNSLAKRNGNIRITRCSSS